MENIVKIKMNSDTILIMSTNGKFDRKNNKLEAISRGITMKPISPVKDEKFHWKK